MPGPAHQGRSGPVAVTLSFQLLLYRVEIDVDDTETADKLRYLVNGAVQDVEPRGVLRYRVRRGPPREVYEEGTRVATVATLDDVLYVLYRSCHRRALHHLTVSGWVQLHAGLASVAGRRFLAVGAKGAGKTTLMARLLHDGHAVDGDELVLTREGVAIAFPRAFHLKAGTERVVPELAGTLATLPSTSTSDGAMIRAFDPARHGFGWRIRPGTVHAVFFLDGGRADQAFLRPLTAVEAVRRLIDQALPAGEPIERRVAACARVVGDLAAFELGVGPVGDTAGLVVETLRRVAPVPVV